MKTTKAKYWWWIAGSTVALLLIVLLFRHDIANGLMTGYRWISNREQVEQFVAAFGSGAPLAFMVLQVLQVVLAPVPGEATGFIGGYLFGTVKGFVYSSLALAGGSWVNFAIGRYLGKRFVRRWIPAGKLMRFDHLLKRQGVIVLIILFVFPGFPKDYLCLFLGITAIPLKAFLLIASIGRMPGTLMLSFQGEFLFQKNYTVFAVVFGVTVLAAFLSIRYREPIYRWTEKLNGKTDGSR
ncbi:MAG: TVP38/TMEM64 family protein [Desulfosarcina sp.]|nr:TVP38/TMEM64 family protein [Desulfosarcina sp.]MBC2743920.1 TVP38/TMEM64 family protein [Desulfosarcina sp.]MBC2766829.1 TVP38/TMEM64 family protein [Desulfosarcina sp.]